MFIYPKETLSNTDATATDISFSNTHGIVYIFSLVLLFLKLN